MSNNQPQQFWLALMLLSLICLNSCTQTSYNNCPIYPIAGSKVADELKNFEGPNFWEWVGRIHKLKLQLEICHNAK